MATIVIDNRRTQAENFARMQESISRGLDAVLTSIAAIKEIRGRQLMEQNIRKAMTAPDVGRIAGGADQWLEPGTGGPTAPASFAPGVPGPAVSQSGFMRPFEGTEQEKLVRLLGVIDQTRAGQPKGGVLDFLNPNVPTFIGNAPMEDLISGAALRQFTQDPIEEEYRRAQLAKLKRDTTRTRPIAIRTESGTGLYFPDTETFKSPEELTGTSSGELIPADTEAEGTNEENKPGFWDNLREALHVAASKASTIPISTQSKTVKGPITGIAPDLMPFDMVEMAKNLDPASKEQLMQIIQEGDPAKMKTAYERLKANYGSVR